MYRQRTNLLSELSTTEGAPPDSYRDQRESHASQMEGKRRQSISRVNNVMIFEFTNALLVIGTHIKSLNTAPTSINRKGARYAERSW